MKRLFINLDICSECPDCVVGCSYYYHPNNRGIDRLRELVTYALVCRHCDSGTCVRACPVEALERDDAGILERHSMRCIGCTSCAHACPFGTIYPDLLPYSFSGCDLCSDRAGHEPPLCVCTCPYGALEYREVEEDPEKGIYLINEHLAVLSHHWARKMVKSGK
ncbi:MAG: 4Fe-4S dicluster domain-containing protein [Candidatus Aureabacteria bacterium]|nr:4Fe-4S dicluster domain-containing protein [Candidatus Auribacterota bacterium]